MKRTALSTMLKMAAALGLVVLAGCAMFMLAGCATTPYVDSRREAGQKAPVGPSTADTPAICYSSYGSGREAAARLADSECAKTGRIATFDHENAWSCTLKTPTRAFFRCVAKP